MEISPQDEARLRATAAVAGGFVAAVLVFIVLCGLQNWFILWWHDLETGMPRAMDFWEPEGLGRVLYPLQHLLFLVMSVLSGTIFGRWARTLPLRRGDRGGTTD